MPLTAEDVGAGGEYDGELLSGLRLEDASLARATFTGCRFERVALGRADLAGVAFDEVELADCDLSSATLAGAKLRDVVFRGCKLLGIDWSAIAQSPIGQPLVFERCQLDHGIFRGLNLRGSAFRDCSAREIDVTGAILTDVVFAGSDLTRARFGRTRLTGADLRGATGYAFDPRENEVRGLRVALPDAAELLRALEITVERGG
jgi:fluoroquinolone resistance protein